MSRHLSKLVALFAVLLAPAMARPDRLPSRDGTATRWRSPHRTTVPYRSAPPATHRWVPHTMPVRRQAPAPQGSRQRWDRQPWNQRYRRPMVQPETCLLECRARMIQPDSRCLLACEARAEGSEYRWGPNGSWR